MKIDGNEIEKAAMEGESVKLSMKVFCISALVVSKATLVLPVRFTKEGTSGTKGFAVDVPASAAKDGSEQANRTDNAARNANVFFMKAPR